MKRKIVIGLLIIALGLGAFGVTANAFVPIGKGVLHILGVALSIFPGHQDAPINTGTAVNTSLMVPDPNFSGDIPGNMENMTVVAELTGPGLTEPITISSKPGQQLMIPPLPQEGTYVLDNIRLMSGDTMVMYADPSMAIIDTIRKLLITNVTSRALTLEEIDELGIMISEENFTAYKFTVAFGTEAGIVHMEMPVVMDRSEEPEMITNHALHPVPPPADLNPVPSMRVPNLQVMGFQLGIPPFKEKLSSDPIVPPIAGAIVIPGDIKFLNQFFEVMLMVTNNAPEGSNLKVTGLNAEIILPAGDDNMPGSLDDPLRIANTENGANNIVPVYDTEDGGRLLEGKESGEGQFLVEGRREGTFRVRIDISGTLLGLPSGPVQVSGKAYGTVIVRNPIFTLTFGQPDVVRDGEEYSLYVMINNTSEVNANLVSLNLPPSDIYGATMIGDNDPDTPVGTVSIDTIEPGDSAVAEFRLISRKTGRVTSTAFVGGDGTEGLFNLRTGVDERGVPLSPNTITLSEWTRELPPDLLYHAVRILGLAQGVATAPTLPEGVTRIPKQNVLKHAYELTEAGLRVKMGEPLSKSVADLVMDWLGNGFRDKGFEEVLRTTKAGRDFLFEAGKIMSTGDAIAVQRAFGETVKYREPFISAVVENTGQAEAYLELTDNSGNALGRRVSGAAVRDIPYGVLVDLDGDDLAHRTDMALLNTEDGAGYDLTIRGVKTGTINVGLIIPDSVGGYVHAVYRNISINAGEVLTGTITAGAQAPVLALGTLTLSPSEVYPYDTGHGPRIVSVMQIPEMDAWDRGRVVAILFDEKIDPASANNPDNYGIDYRDLDRQLVNPPSHARVLPGKRIITVMFTCTISPFFDYDLILSGIRDDEGNPLEPEPARVPIIASFNNPGGIVSGTVRRGDSEPIPYTQVLLWETFPLADGESKEVITNMATTDAEGRYQIDYAARGAGFRLETSDPQNGQKGSIASRIVMDRQHLNLDILLLGLGTITGRVVKADDLTPVEHALVSISSLTGGPGFLPVFTDAEGRFAFSMVPVGNVNLNAEYSYWKGAIGAVISGPGETVDVTLPVYSTQAGVGTVQGRVFDSDGKTPLDGMPVVVMNGKIYSDWRPTDANGNFKLDNVPAGQLRVYTFRQDTYEQAETIVTLEEGKTVFVNLVLPGRAKIIGTVLDYNNEPVAGAQVSGGFSIVETDGNGDFVIENVPIGRIDVRALHPERGDMAGESVYVGSPGEVVRVVLRYPAPVSKGIINGHVYGADGAPVADQGVLFICGTDMYGATTNSEGYYEKELRACSYTIRIANRALTDGDERRATLAVDGQVVNGVDLRFKGFGRIEGIVYSPEDTPIVATVIFTRTLFSPMMLTKYTVEERYISSLEVEPDVTGKFVIENVRLGDFRLQAENAFYSEPVVHNGKVSEVGETVFVEFHLKPTATIRGQVFLANGERAGDGVIMTLKTGSIAEMDGRTDPDGSYAFDLVPPGGFTIEAYDPVTGNYGIARTSVETGDEAVVDIELLGKGTVNVQVTQSDGTPIPDAAVWLNSGSVIARLTGEFPVLYTDSNGMVTFDNVPEGPFSVTADDPGSLAGGKNGGTIVEDHAEVNLSIKVGASGTVFGNVTTPDGSGPMPYAQVEIKSARRPSFFTTTDAEGNYLFEYVPLGDFTLEVFHPGTARVGKGSGKIDYNTEEEEINIRMIAQGTVEGYVRTAGGSPVAGAAVRVKSLSVGSYGVIITTSNLEGRFRVSGIPEGIFSVSATHPFINISGQAEGEITFEGEEVWTDVELQPVGTVYGRTLAADGATIAPYAEVWISGRNYHGSAISNGDGEFVFDAVPVGTYAIHADEQNGLDGGTAAATISYEGELYRVDVVFVGTGDVFGTVMDEGNNPPLPYAEVVIRSAGPRPITLKTFTDADGKFGFIGIPLGEFSITATVPDSFLGGAYNGVLETDGQVVPDADITIEQSGSITGSVFAEDGETPVDQALITCRLFKQSGGFVVVRALTDEEGIFTMDGLPLGSFTILAQEFASNGAGNASGEITAAISDVTLDPIVLDESLPSVVSIDPENGAVQVPLDSVITIQFSEPVNEYSVTTSGNIIVTAGIEPVDGTVTVSEDRMSATFVPDVPLPEFTSVQIVVKNVRDDLNKIMAEPFVSAFVTADVTPPYVLSGRLILGAFVAEFSEPVLQSSGSMTAVNTATGEPVDGVFTYSAGDTVLSLYPSETLPDNTSFELVIDGFTDVFGNAQPGEFRATYLTGDEEPPAISLISNAVDNTAIEGTPVTITAVPVNSPDIYAVDFRVEGVIVETVKRAPFAMVIVPDRDVIVTAIPTDCSGNTGAEVSVPLMVIPNDMPVVSITSPSDGAVYGSGKNVSITLQGDDDLGLKELELQVQSTDIATTMVYKLGTDALSASHTFTFRVPTSTSAGTVISIEAVARDIREVESTPAVITLTTEDTTKPVVKITSFKQGFKIDPAKPVPVDVAASDNDLITRVDFTAGDPAFITDFREVTPPSSLADVSFSLVLPDDYMGGSKIPIVVSATDASGNVGFAQKITLTVDDLIPPTVQIDLPVNGTSVTAGSTITVSASANDNDAVDRVEFFLDGQSFATDKYGLSGAYKATWNVQSEDIGTSRNLSARAYDKFGNMTDSAPVTVNVVADCEPPVVTMITNIPGIVFAEGNTVKIMAKATDNIDVARVELLVNGSVVASEQYPRFDAVIFDYTVEYLIPAGQTSIQVPLEVRATDDTGNVGTSSEYTISIIHDDPPTVTFNSPIPGQSVLGGAEVKINATVRDDRGIDAMEIRVNGVLVAEQPGYNGTLKYAETVYTVPENALGSILTVEVSAVDSVGFTTTETMDLHVPLAISPVSSITSAGEVIDVAFSGDYAYVLDTISGITVVNISDPANPLEIRTIPMPGLYSGLEVFGGILYAYGDSGLFIADLSDPADPIMIDQYITPETVLDITYEAGYIYGAMGVSGILVLDVHDPANLLGAIFEDISAGQVDAEDGYLFSWRGSGSTFSDVWSLSDPSNPMLLKTHQPGQAGSFDVEGTIMFSTNGPYHFRLWDVSGVPDMLMLGSSYLGSGNVYTRSVDLRWPYALHSSDTYGWGMVELFQSGDIVPMGMIDAGGKTDRTKLYNGYVYSADEGAGLKIYDLRTINEVIPEVQLSPYMSGDEVEKGQEIEVEAHVMNDENAEVVFMINGMEMHVDEIAPYTYRFRVPAGNSSITLSARAVNLGGMSAESPEVVLSVVQETVPPLLTVTSPPQDGTIPVLIEGETLTVEGFAADEFGVQRVELEVNGMIRDFTAVSDFVLRFTVPDDSIAGTDRFDDVIVRAFDVSGNMAETTFSIRVMDDLPPQVSFISPVQGAIVPDGTSITLSVRVTDDWGVDAVDFYEGANILGAGILTSPDVYTFRYHVPEAQSEETLTFIVKAYDFKGQLSEAQTGVIVRPDLTGTLSSIGTDAAVVDVEGDLAVTGGTGKTLNIYNVGVPTAPVQLSAPVELAELNVRQVKIVGDRIYAVSGRYLNIVDIGDPAHPSAPVSVVNTTPYSIDVYKEIAFVGRNYGRISAYDVSGDVPKIISEIRFSDYYSDNVVDLKVEPDRGLLYAVVQSSNTAPYMKVIDVRDVTAMKDAGGIYLDTGARRIEIAEGLAYIASGDGWFIIDLARAGTPDFGRDDNNDSWGDDILSYTVLTSGAASDISVAGDIAYIADNPDGISLVDIADPSSPTMHAVPAISTPGQARELEISGGFAFVADGNRGLSIVKLGDISPVVRKDQISITSPKQDGTVDIIGTAGAVIDDGPSISVKITNISQGVMATSVQFRSGDPFVLNITAAIGDEIVIEAIDEGGKTSGIISLGRVTSGEVVQGNHVFGFATVVAVSGNLAAAGDDQKGITVFEITDPSNPVLLSSFQTQWGGSVRDIKIKSNNMYVASNHMLYVYDITDSSRPKYLGEINQRYQIYALDFHDDILFMGWDSGVYDHVAAISTFDATNGTPSAIRQGGSWYLSLGNGIVQDITFDENTNLLYAVVDNGVASYLSVIDAANEADLAEIGNMPLPGTPRKVKVVNNILYITNGDGMVAVSLQRLGAANFGSDSDGDGRADDIIGSVYTHGFARGLDIQGKYAYIANGVFKGVQVIDISDPFLLRLVASIDTPGNAVDIGVWRQYAYVADGEGGLSIIRLYTDVAPSLDRSLVSMEVDTATGMMEVTGDPGAVHDDIYPVDVHIESVLNGTVYSTQVLDASDTFSVTLPWIPGDDLYITLLETTPDPLTVGPIYLGRVPVSKAVSSVPFPGYVQTVDSDGTFAAVGTKGGIVVVYDVRNIADPIPLLTMDMGYEIKQVRVSNGYLYVINQHDTIYASFARIDLNNYEIVTTKFANYVYSTDSYDGIVFIGRTISGSRGAYIEIFLDDAAGSYSSVSTTWFGKGDVNDIYYDPAYDRLYAITGGPNSWPELNVFEQTPANTLDLLGKISIPDNPYRIEVKDDHAYIASISGTTIVDLTRLDTGGFGGDGDEDGWADDILSYIPSYGEALDVDVRNGYAYVADGVFNNGVKVFDVIDPYPPVEIARIPTPNDARELKIVGDYLFIAGGDAGLQIFRLY